MKLQAKTFIAALFSFVSMCFVTGCQYSIEPIGDSQPAPTQKNVEANNDPIFRYKVTQIEDAVYSITVHAKNSDQKYITGKVWGTELWVASGNGIAPNTDNKAKRLEDWREGSLEENLYHTGIQRTTESLPAGWYAIRGSYYESGFKATNGHLPPCANHYDINTLAPERSQWYYFQVIQPR